jgi:hypothetical protein
MSNQFAYGTVTGTGAAINVELGWLPDRVEVFNYTDGDTIDYWVRGMTDGTSITVSTAAASRASNGISSYAGSTTARKGFTIGSGISESAKVLYWTAQRYMP